MIRQYTQDMIVEKLCSYKSIKTKLSLIQYELTELTSITAASTGKMNFLETINECETSISALSYMDVIPQDDILKKIIQQWKQLHCEIQRLEFYFSLLRPDLRAILILHYYEEKTWNEIELETGCSYRTVMRRKNEAIEDLTHMYNFSQSFRNNTM